MFFFFFVFYLFFIFFVFSFIIGVFRSFNWRDERFLRLIRTEDGLVGSPFKKERIVDQWRVSLSVGELVDAINDGLGGRLLGPASS